MVSDPITHSLNLPPVQRIQRGSLNGFFSPKSVAVIGAKADEASVGRTVLWNLLSSPFGGTIYPVNPKRAQVLGIKSFPRVGDIPEPVDLAIIVTPASTVPGLVRECASAGIGAAIVISAGFQESGHADLEKQLAEESAGSGMRIVGPNCLGIMSPVTGLNATFASRMALRGNVAFLSQSGALCTAVLDWSHGANVGFSAFVSVGSMVDVGWGDLIDHFGDDPNTKSIIIYMESIGDPRSFLSAAREVALTKPIIIIKAGRTEGGALAAASHTGALTGSDEVLDAAFRRSGVLRVNTIADLFYMAETLASQPRPKGPRLTILTNAGGPGVLATDALISNGGELAKLSDKTVAQLNELLPEHWSKRNPIDVLGDAGPDRYKSAVEIAAADPESDGLLVILTPQAMTDPLGTAAQIQPFGKQPDKPILASWMGGPGVAAGVCALNAVGIPTFQYPDTAARAFDYMWRYSYNLKGLYETPALLDDASQIGPAERSRVSETISQVRSTGRTLLTEPESKRILAAYGIPTTNTEIAQTESEAVVSACRIGFPVVLKLYSETITHKTDVGGVQLNLANPDEVRKGYRSIEAALTRHAGGKGFEGVTVQPMVKAEGYELIIGSTTDPEFGPVLLFGTGGQLVEVFRDRALALPPLTTTLARRMMEQTKIYKALKGVRGRQPVDMLELEKTLVRFSQLVAEQKWIKEIDINPLLVGPGRIIALDARVVLHGLETSEENLPQPAIRPYPVQYVAPWAFNDGTSVLIRPIRPEDEPMMVDFHESLSERSIYQRFFNVVKLEQRVAHDRLARVCFVDYDRQIALVAEGANPSTRAREIMGVGRLTRISGCGDAEVAVLVADRAQRRGLGSELLARLVDIAREERITRLVADVLQENTGMITIFSKRGFELVSAHTEGVVRAVLDL